MVHMIHNILTYIHTCLPTHYAGVKKHIWVSTSIDLRIDAARDLSDIGAKDISVMTLRKSADDD